MSTQLQERDAPEIEYDDLEVLPHQTRILIAPFLYPDIDFFFMVAGYNAGKSFTGVLQANDLENRYQGSKVNIGIGGTTITRLRQTLIADLLNYWNAHGVDYHSNGKENSYTVGTVKFTLIGTENPETIYAHNFNAFLCDELDELPQEKALAAFVAIQERTRVPLPDGREAFSVFYTTAQGYRGTYQIIEEMKERGDPYYLIHARSLDNTFISKRWVERMTRIYNEVERRVFLGGEFANLTTGRVYYGFDESKNKLPRAPWEIDGSHIIKIGQDLNSGFSKGTAIIKGGKNKAGESQLHVVKTWSFGEIGHAPNIIRGAFPPNEIRWYPDASGKEIIAGYAAEIRQAGIITRIGTINPSVIDRIFFVNKLFESDRLLLWPGTEKLAMALKVRQYNDAGDPEKGKGEAAPDHWCLPAGTEILTDDGSQSIENVKPGMSVLTRSGFHKVIAAGMTGIKEIGNYRGVVCTPDHPVFVGEWKPARTLTQSDTLCIIREVEAKRCIKLRSYLKAASSDEIRVGKPELTEFTIAAILRATKDCSIGQYGLISMVRYLLATIFIISMAIFSIMIQAIFRLYPTESIASRVQSIFKMWLRRSLRRTYGKPEKRQRCGIAARKVGGGIGSMFGRILQRMKWLKECAKNAGKSLSEYTRAHSVHADASLSTGELPGKTTSIESALGAEGSSKSTNMRGQNAAANPAGRSGVAVFNLTVEGSHEFYADGVLVSNCDSLEYVIWRIVSEDLDFRDLWRSSRTGRAEMKAQGKATA